MWSFEIISDWNQGLNLCGEFYNSAPESHVFAHPALLDAWRKTYLPIRNLKPYFVTGVDDCGHRMIMPLTLWHKNWKNALVKALVPVGHSDFDYHNPIFTEPITEVNKECFWSEFSNFISTNISYDYFSIEGITDQLSLEGKKWKKDEICPALNLIDINSEADLFSFFKTSLRGDIRRQIRRLEEIGSLGMKEYSNWEDIPHETFEAFMYNHSLRWPRAYKAPHFHENLLREGLQIGVVHFSVLMAGDTEVAWHLGFEDKGRFYYYMPAGNQEYLKSSPVKVHLFLLVRRAVEKGYKLYDHLRGEENYKSGWSNESQYVNTISSSKDGTMTNLKRILLKSRGIILPPPTITE